MVVEKPLDSLINDAGGQLPLPFVGDGSFKSMGLKPWQKLKPSVEILCNNQACNISFFFYFFYTTTLLINLIYIFFYKNK